MTESAHFDSDWLRLREPIDHRSRATALMERLETALPASDELSVIDLGSGSGSNLRYLAPRLARPQAWTLIDHDSALLELAAETRVTGTQLTIKARCLDLNQIDKLDLARPELLTASAWLDLVSTDWIERFAAQLTVWKTPALIALSVDGRRGFIDPSGRDCSDGDDEALRRAFNQHQRQPKGLGRDRALGPDAVHVLAETLSENGFDVTLEPSDWVLPAGSAEALSLGCELLKGWAEAANDLANSASLPAIQPWRHDRLGQINRGALGMRVGHLDLLAIPGQ